VTPLAGLVRTHHFFINSLLSVFSYVKNSGEPGWRPCVGYSWTQSLSRSINLDQGNVNSAPRTLYIDCTARGIAPENGNQSAVFSESEISLKMVRMYQPTFSSALIAYLEANVQDLSRKQELTQSVPMTDTVEDWLGGQFLNMSNQEAWAQDENLPVWLAECRLDLLSKMVRNADKDDTEKQAIIARLMDGSGSALRNIQRLLDTNSK